jgi:hypothetical protein
MTAPAAVTVRTARPLMRARDFAELADEVAVACQRYGARAWSEDDRDRLAAALWRFIHPDLAHGPADPYFDPDDELGADREADHRARRALTTTGVGRARIVLTSPARPALITLSATAPRTTAGPATCTCSCPSAPRADPGPRARPFTPYPEQETHRSCPLETSP